MCVCVFVCVCVCVWVLCVCVSEKERECVCVRERERVLVQNEGRGEVLQPADHYIQNSTRSSCGALRYTRAHAHCRGRVVCGVLCRV